MLKRNEWRPSRQVPSSASLSPSSRGPHNCLLPGHSLNYFPYFFLLRPYPCRYLSQVSIFRPCRQLYQFPIPMALSFLLTLPRSSYTRSLHHSTTFTSFLSPPSPCPTPPPFSKASPWPFIMLFKAFILCGHARTINLSGHVSSPANYVPAAAGLLSIATCDLRPATCDLRPGLHDPTPLSDTE